MAGNYKDLRVWQRAIELVVQIYGLTRRYPKDELYGLTSQMRRAAISVASNIAEGKGRATSKELAHFLSNARRSLRELETQTIISARLHYISQEVEDEVLGTIDDLGRMLHGLISFANSPSSES